MNASNKQHYDERQLWDRYTKNAKKQPTLSDPEPELLAAYLDGNANESQVEHIESLMAQNSALIDQIIELRSLQNAAPAPVSQTVLDRAKALETETPPDQQQIVAPARGAHWHRFHWAAAAAAVLLACLGGYSAGTSTSQGQQRLQAQKSSQVSFGLDELIGDPTLALIFQPNGRNGGQK